MRSLVIMGIKIGCEGVWMTRDGDHEMHRIEKFDLKVMCPGTIPFTSPSKVSTLEHRPIDRLSIQHFQDTCIQLLIASRS